MIAQTKHASGSEFGILNTELREAFWLYELTYCHNSHKNAQLLKRMSAFFKFFTFALRQCSNVFTQGVKKQLYKSQICNANY